MKKLRVGKGTDPKYRSDVRDHHSDPCRRIRRDGPEKIDEEWSERLLVQAFDGTVHDTRDIGNLHW